MESLTNIVTHAKLEWDINKFSKTKEAERIPFLVKEKHKYLDEISKCTGRNVITYYSGWLQKPTASDVSINDKDINAFMEAVYKLDKSKGADLNCIHPAVRLQQLKR